MHDSHWWNVAVDSVQATAIPIAIGGLFFAWLNRRKTDTVLELDRTMRADGGMICPAGKTTVRYSVHQITLTNHSDISSAILGVQMEYGDSEARFPQAITVEDGDDVRLRTRGNDPRELVTDSIGRAWLSLPMNIPPHNSIGGWLAFSVPDIEANEFMSAQKWVNFLPPKGDPFRHEIISSTSSIPGT